MARVCGDRSGAEVARNTLLTVHELWGLLGPPNRCLDGVRPTMWWERSGEPATVVASASATREAARAGSEDGGDRAKEGRCRNR